MSYAKKKKKKKKDHKGLRFRNYDKGSNWPKNRQIINETYSFRCFLIL